MMKYKLEEKKQKSDEKELTLSLKLESDGSVRVIGKDNENYTWHLLKFLPDGTFYRFEGLPNDIGLQIDGLSCIEESEND